MKIYITGPSGSGITTLDKGLEKKIWYQAIWYRFYDSGIRFGINPDIDHPFFYEVEFNWLKSHD